MARIAGVDIPRDKQVAISLTYIYGIGKTTAKQVVETAGVPAGTRVRELTNDQLDAIRSEISELKVEGDIRRERSQDIRRLMEIGSYRGVRHRKNLPVRGQKTKNNARTRKGPSVAIAGKKK